MMNKGKIFIACALTLISTTLPLIAAPVKSIDQFGNVTYSDKPTGDAASSIEIQLDKGPTGDQIEEAKKRSQQTVDAANKAAEERDALAEKRQAERNQAAADKAARTPDVIIIENESGYPADYPLGSRPPVVIPPGNPGNGTGHPIYKPPGTRPPIARPLPSPR